MSKLVELLTQATDQKFGGRITTYPSQKLANGEDRNFSVKKQGIDGQAVDGPNRTEFTAAAATAVNFYNDTYATGFTVGQGKSGISLSVGGFKKSATDDNTKYTGTTGAESAANTALNRYGYYVSLADRIKFGTTSMANKATESNTHFAEVNKNTKGVLLGYSKA